MQQVETRPGATTDRPAQTVVAMVSSAGGMAALTAVLGGLPADLPAGVVVVQHLDRRHRSLMADILSRRTPLRVSQATDGEVLGRGEVHVAVPDRHLVVNADGTLSLTTSELVQFVRPSADILLESVATSYRSRAVAVILSGSGRDGSMGVQAISRAGGRVIVQDEQSAEFSGMPAAAIATGKADYVLPLEHIAPAVARLVRGEAVDAH